MAFFLQLAIVPPVLAQSVGPSGLPLPRFVTLKSKRVNMRVGPGRDYQVQWLYVKKGLPMEIIREFGNWRKVRDPGGNVGWVLHSLLSGKRAVIIAPWDISPNEKNDTPPVTNMRESKSPDAKIVAHIEAGSLATIEQCEKDWCRLQVSGPQNSTISGYVKQSLLWGVYPDETLKN